MKIPDKYKTYRLWGKDIEKISIHLWMQYVWGNNDRWELHVILDDSTTARELRENWGKIDLAREEMRKNQGSDPKVFSHALLFELEKQKNANISYGTLAKDLNFDALCYILWAIDQKKDDTNKRAGHICFINLLQTMGMKNIEIRQWEKKARTELGKEISPWGVNDGPIDRERVIASIKKYQKSVKSKKIINIAFKPYHLYDIWLSIINARYWERAEEMLSVQNEVETTKYKSRLRQRVKNILLSMKPRVTVDFLGLKNP